MLTAELLCLDDMQGRYAPQADPAVYRRARARVHYRYGRYLFTAGEYAQARASLAAALRHGWRTPDLPLYLALSWLPRPVLNLARRLKRQAGT